jgi:hypothetical protein
MLSGDRIGGHGYYGWNSGGANELPSAAFTGYATENHAPTAQGGELRIEVIPNGTVTPVDAVYIRNNRLLEVTNGILLSDSTDTTNGVMRINGGAAQVRQNGAWKPVVEPLQTALQSSQLTSSSNSTLTNIAGLEFSVTAGRTYRIQIYIMYRSAAMSTGLALTLGNTGAVGTLAATATMTNVSDGTSANFFGAITAFGDVATSTAVPIINTDYLAKIEGIFVCTASGTIVPRFRSETNGTQVTVQIGSNIEVREF